ncbi:MAG: hypothetical protein KAJ63_13150 [Methyloprofundus sp.]|nr:hypothetical protein [Methyloprofundus sp.]
MEKSRFQIGKLFKMFGWAFLIAVPIGMYAMYYSETQRNYFNQRNFRALNELSQQFELHFIALEKLFLFVPNKFIPTSKEEATKENYKKLSKSLNALLKELERNNSLGTDTPQNDNNNAEQKKIDQIKRQLLNNKEAIDSTPPSTVEDKIQDIGSLKEYCKDKSNINRCIGVINQINLDQQKSYSREIYKRRLQSNDFLNNLKVTEVVNVSQLEQWQGYCSDSSEKTLFILNNTSKNAKLTAYPCQGIQGKLEKLKPLEEGLKVVKAYTNKIKSSSNKKEQKEILDEIIQVIEFYEQLSNKLTENEGKLIKKQKEFNENRNNKELKEEIYLLRQDISKIKIFNILNNILDTDHKSLYKKLKGFNKTGFNKLLKPDKNNLTALKERIKFYIQVAQAQNNQDEQKTGQQDPLFFSKIELDYLKKSLITLKNKLNLDREKIIDGVIFKIPLESLLGEYLPLEFDGILLSNSHGEVLVQKEIKSLQWDEKKTFLKLSSSGTSVSDIGWLLDLAKEQIKSKNNLSERLNITEEESQDANKAHLNKSKAKGNEIELGHSTFVDLVIAGKEYLIYIHPFIVDNKIYKDQLKNPHNNNNPPKPHFSKFYILGFVQKSKTGGLVFSLGFVNIAFALLLLISCFLAWPFLKLNFMNIKEAITAHDIRILLFSFLIGLVILTTFFLTIFTYNGMEERLDNKAKEIARQIETAYRSDLKKVIEKLSTYNEDNYQNDCQDIEMHAVKKSNTNKFSCLAESGWKQAINKNSYAFPYVRDIFTLNNKGEQLGPIIYFVERLFSSKPLKLDFRNYFIKARDGDTWHWQEQDDKDQPFYIERIHNFSDGQKASQVSMPVNRNGAESIASMGSETQAVRVATTYFPSIAATVLPASFSFAIIEDASGKIIYHSQDQKSFVENFYAESDYTPHLIAHTLMRHSGEVESLYHGRPTKFFIKPIKHLPWSVVVYYNIGRLQMFMVKTAIITLLIYLLYLIPIIFLLIIIHKLPVKKWDFLWPHYHKAAQYKKLALILIASNIVYILYVLNMSGWWFFLSLIGITFIFLITIRLCIGNLNPFLSIRKCHKSCRGIFLLCMSIVSLSFTVIPTIGFFKETFRVNQHHYIRINQLDYAESMQQRALKLDQFARMFFPLKFDKSNNSDTRLHFTTDSKPENFMEFYDADNRYNFLKGAYTGIFGFEQYKEKTKQIDNQEPEAPHKKGPADFFIEYLLKINFQFSQQHVVGNNYLDRDAWKWEGDTLTFETDDSAGTVTHSISIPKSELGSVIVEGIVNDKFGWFRIFLLFAFTFAIWLFILDFFSRKVLGIFLPEPIRQRHLLSKWQTNTNINSYNILIRGENKKYKKLLEKRQVSFDEEKEVKFLDLLTSDFNFPISSFSNKKIFVLDNFDAAIWDAARRIKALAYLEELVNHSGSHIYIFIRCQISPLYRLTNPQAYPYFPKPDKPEPHIEIDEITRWSKLLAKFDKHYCWEPLRDELDIDSQEGLSDKQTDLIKAVRLESSLWPDMDATCLQFESKIAQDKSDSLDKKQILKEMREQNLYANKYAISYNRDKELAADQLDLIKLINTECKIWPELQHIRNELIILILDRYTHLFNKDQVLEYIYTHTGAFYRNYWELCTRDERLALTQLATGRFINPTNQDVIEHLYRRGYIKRAPYFQISNLTFERFILTAELLENVQGWESSATDSVWATIKVPLFIILFSLTGLLLYIASDTFDVTLGLLSGLVAFIPILLKGVGTVRDSS